MARHVLFRTPTQFSQQRPCHRENLCAKCHADGQNVIVLGLGASGRAACHLAHSSGARVTAMDLNTEIQQTVNDSSQHMSSLAQCEVVLGPHPESALRNCSLLIISPGIPMASPFVQLAAQQGIPITSELAFAAAYLPPSVHTAAITGTNGKSTTTVFTSQLLRCTGESTWEGGNLGTPLSSLAADLQNGATFKYAVLEVSSYQLEAPGTFAPAAAAILNVTPDHLQRHGSMQRYTKTKLKLFQSMHSSSAKLFPESLARHMPASAGAVAYGSLPGVTIHGNEARVQCPHWSGPKTLHLEGLSVPGAHNRMNAATAAFLAASIAPELAWEDIQACVPQLKAPPHRMQLVLQTAGVRWYNDSKATNVAATKVALESIRGSCIILLGGQGKEDAKGNLGFQELAPLLRRPHTAVTFGRHGTRISAELDEAGVASAATCATLREAVHAAALLVRRGGADTVLLSPGCASFDEFVNFEDRGRQFAEYAVEAGPC